MGPALVVRDDPVPSSLAQWRGGTMNRGVIGTIIGVLVIIILVIVILQMT
jgi:hypothetical protein